MKDSEPAPSAHVLVVDDDPSVRTMIADYLGDNEIEVTGLANGREIARTPGLHGSDAAGWGLATGIMGTVLGIFLILTVVVGIAAPS